MKTYRIGIIGYGGFGTFLHQWWDRQPGVEVIAVANSGHHFPDAEHCKTYRDWRDLIADPRIDIVSICTPPGLHADMACEAMLAGKHVLLEKPVALTLESARNILKVQQQTGRIITVNHMIRYNPIIQSLMELTAGNILGTLRHVVVNNYAQDASLPAEHWFWDKEMSGGILVEHGVHFFDIVHALSRQQFKKVCGTSDSRNVLQQDRVAAMVTYENGLIANYYHAFSGPGFFEQTTLELVYDLARIQVEGWMPMKGFVKAMVNESISQQLARIPGWRVISTQNIPDEANVQDTGGDALTYCGGKTFEVSQMISGSFDLGQSKSDVYGQCVQAILSDMIAKIENSDHVLTITIEDAIDALEIAILASE